MAEEWRLRASSSSCAAALGRRRRVPSAHVAAARTGRTQHARPTLRMFRPMVWAPGTNEI
eukprot:CAMPEP_0170423944 /NCGR_PEP_ID=MMETSP0117_2-20130122/37281_1 /TAXON_ID=400756 /ORGANISM="Durinskia baltica, Strain CSIRO CS-38" /LENGTH=59 /DNA_ID=CAMNT_0010682753 /DNA_START=19 /DNA_END=195 /DNA_ORIENTATION=+